MSRFNYRLVSLVLMGVLMAQLSGSQAVRAADQIGNQSFCAELGGLSQRATSQLKAQTRALSDTQNQRLSRLGASRKKFDQTIALQRSQWDKQRIVHYRQLLARAKTEQQKSAIRQYESTIEQAVAARRTEFDTAISDYRKAADEAVSRSQDSASVAQDFGSSVESAFAQAKADCSSNVEPGLVRQALNQQLTQAKARLMSNSSPINQLSQDILKLEVAKRHRVRSTVEAFVRDAEAAKQKLISLLSFEDEESLSKTLRGHV